MDTLVTVLGTLGAVALGWWLSRRTTKQDRAEVRREAQREFQRTTLLSLQEACTHTTREAGQVHVADFLRARQIGIWDWTTHNYESIRKLTSALVEMGLLAERVADDEIREQVNGLSVACLRVSKARSQAESDAAIEEVLSRHSELGRALGERVRDLL